MGNYRIFMKNKKIYGLVLAMATLSLTGCVSNDFRAVKAKVYHLERRVNHLQEQLASVQNELGIVKKQRVVRSPTGAPRYSQGSTSAGANFEKRAFSNAVELYKAGNLTGAMNAFENFNKNFPTSSLQGQSLYYLGQAGYAARQYATSQKALEKLVFASSRVNPSANELLKKVYKAQGKINEVNRLNAYLQSKQQ